MVTLRCLEFPTRVVFVITGEQIRDLREQRGLTQGELGKLVGVSMRTIGNWERGETIPRSREGRIRAALGFSFADAVRNPRISEASDAELLAEVAGRMSGRFQKPRSELQQLSDVQDALRVARSSVGGGADQQYGLAAREGDENIGQDQIEHEP